MMKINRFEDILAWQKAKELTKGIYFSLKQNRDYGFKDQIQRASISIMNNIAEGFERRSDSEFKQFLYIAKGSCGEVRSMLILAQELTYVDKKVCMRLLTEAEEISRMLSNLIKTLNRESPKP